MLALLCGGIVYYQSNLLAGLQEWGRSSAGRALAWHARGQGFDPPRLHQLKPKIDGIDNTTAR